MIFMFGYFWCGFSLSLFFFSCTAFLPWKKGCVFLYFGRRTVRIETCLQVHLNQFRKINKEKNISKQFIKSNTQIWKMIGKKRFWGFCWVTFKWPLLIYFERFQHRSSLNWPWTWNEEFNFGQRGAFNLHKFYSLASRTEEKNIVNTHMWPLSVYFRRFWRRKCEVWGKMRRLK